MAICRIILYLVFSLYFSASLTIPVSEADPQSSELSGTYLRDELDQLKSRISALESSIDWTTRALESKEEKITQLENIIQKKSREIASLQDEIKLFQKSEDASGRVGADQTSAEELERKVERLRDDIQIQNKKTFALRVRTETAEEKMHRLNTKLENLQKINDEQRIIIRKTEQALQVAEEELVNTKLEAASISDELLEIHQSWLPRVFVVHILHFQSFMATAWNTHGRPALNLISQKASKTLDECIKSAVPHIRTIRNDFVEPWANFVTAKANELYHVSKKLISPYLIEMQNQADPYLQEIKSLCKPYTDQIVLLFGPYLDVALVVLKPYAKIAMWVCGKVLHSAIAYHKQVQISIGQKLQRNEFVEPQLADDLAWLTATGFIVLPMIILLSKSISKLIGKKPKRQVRRHRDHHHIRRRAKRSHSDSEK